MSDAPGAARPLAGLLAFIRGETAGGVLLVCAAVVAVIWANSPYADLYKHILHLPVGITIGHTALHADVHFLVDDALMAIFFLLVGLEIRHEVTVGQLASVPLAAAPGVAALGGMVAPALVYLAFTFADPTALPGWAIPTATDIAFSLAVLRLLGPRVPGGLRIFLTALAIIDDLGAILIIAIFFSKGIDLGMLGGAVAVWIAMSAASRARMNWTLFYVVGFVALWLFLVRSGVHATLAGVATAFAVPMRGKHSVGHKLEHRLNAWVAFGILPLFALANAGFSFSEVTTQVLHDPILPGIALGLFLGKPLGVFGATWLAARARLIVLPDGLNFRMVFGASALCGIGFTMSLFIGLLAFPADDRTPALKLAVFAASVASAALGALVVRSATRPEAA